MATRTLYRPVGIHELRLVREADYAGFPPRLPEQPIFYPVLEVEYARQIAREWNTQDEASGYMGAVTAFDVDAEYLDRFEEHVVGGAIHRELWVPAEELHEFNHHIRGPIRVLEVFCGEGCEESARDETDPSPPPGEAATPRDAPGAPAAGTESPGTATEPGGSAASLEALERYLRWALGTELTVRSVQPLPGGSHRNLLVRVATNGRHVELVVRTAPPPDRRGVAHEVVPYDLELEFEALRDLELTHLRTPRVWGLDAEGRFLGSPAFLEEHIAGPTLLQTAVKKPATPAVITAFCRTIVEMNAIRPSQVPSVVRRRGHEPGAPADLVGWLGEHVTGVDAPRFFRRGLERLRKTAPSDRPEMRFGNGDLDPGNFILVPSGEIAVVDWEYVGFDDPLAALMLLHTWPVERPFLRDHPIHTLYCRETGIDLRLLPWYELHAALRGWLAAFRDGHRSQAAMHAAWIRTFL